MTKEIAEKLRELIKAEVESGIAANWEDESGYRGHNDQESRIADKIFKELLIMVEKS